jgi:hypothetical protein
MYIFAAGVRKTKAVQISSFYPTFAALIGVPNISAEIIPIEPGQVMLSRE